MWTADSSHFVSLLPTTHKHVDILSFTERPSGSPLPLLAFVSNSHYAFRKSLVWIPLDVLMEGVFFFFTLKNFEKIVGSKVFAIKMRRIYRFLILGKHENILECEEFVVCVCLYIYIYIYTNLHI